MSGEDNWGSLDPCPSSDALGTPLAIVQTDGDRASLQTEHVNARLPVTRVQRASTPRLGRLFKITIVRTQKLRHNTINVIYVITLVIVVVSVDIAFFRHHFGYRLIANIAIVLIFIVSYFRYVRRS